MGCGGSKNAESIEEPYVDHRRVRIHPTEAKMLFLGIDFLLLPLLIMYRCWRKWEEYNFKATEDNLYPCYFSLILFTDLLRYVW